MEILSKNKDSYDIVFDFKRKYISPLYNDFDGIYSIFKDRSAEYNHNDKVKPIQNNENTKYDIMYNANTSTPRHKNTKSNPSFKRMNKNLISMSHRLHPWSRGYRDISEKLSSYNKLIRYEDGNFVFVAPHGYASGKMFCVLYSAILV